MGFKSSAFAAAAVVALIGAAVTFGATPASASCRGPVEGYSRGYIQNAVQIIARSKWRGEVRRRYGSSFVGWSLAKDKVERCNKIQPGRRWHCTARARPCNS